MTGTARSTANNPSLYRVLLALALLVTTYLLLQGVLGSVRTPISEQLYLHSWRMESIARRASSDAVVKMLDVNDYVENTITPI